MEFLAFVGPIWGVPVMPIQWDKHIQDIKDHSAFNGDGDTGLVNEWKRHSKAKAAMKKLKSKVQRGREKLRVTKKRWGFVEQDMELEQMPFIQRPIVVGGRFDGAGDEGGFGGGYSTGVTHAEGVGLSNGWGQSGSVWCNAGTPNWMHRQAWKSKETRYLLLESPMKPID